MAKISIIDRIRSFGTKAVTPAPLDTALPGPSQTRQSTWGTGYGDGQYRSLLTVRLPESNRNWRDIAGDLMLNSVVAIGIDWYVRNFPQGQLRVMRPTADGQAEPVPDHPILALLRDPDPYSQAVPGELWDNMIAEYRVQGLTYLVKRRNPSNGIPGALQSIPPDMIAPQTDKDGRIISYRYTASGWSRDLPVDDVIRVKYGRDPDDWKLGRSPLTSVLAEIAADNMASRMGYGLASSPVPSFIVGPPDGDSVMIQPEDAQVTKSALQQNFRGDRSGGVVVMQQPYKIERVAWSPKDMALDDIRRKPEERICAALGLNPLVLQLGSGLERATYSNLDQATRSAWTDGMIPLYAAFARSLTAQLLPDFPETLPGDYLEWDTSNIPALQSDLNEDSERAERLYKAGIIDQATAKRISGITPGPDDEGRYFPSAQPTPIIDLSLMPAGQPVRTPQEIAALVTSAGTLIRSGFAPEAALAAVGLDPIQHLGLLPVTVQTESKALQLEPGEESGLKYYPTDSMRNAAKRALAWREAGNKGGTLVGLRRANQLVNGDKLSEDTILRMHSFFSRHEVDKQAEGFHSGEPGFPSPGRVAWDLWGGDSGQSWARNLARKIVDQADETKSATHPVYGWEIDADTL